MRNSLSMAALRRMSAGRAATLALIAVLLFAASSWGAERTQELVFLSWGDVERFRPWLDAFETAYPDVYVTYIGGPYGEHWDRFQVMVASDAAPDVALIDGYDYATAAARGLIVDVTEWAEQDGVIAELRSQYNPAYFRELQVNGRFYSVAQIFAARLMLFYNKRHLSEAGLPDINALGSNWTWSTFFYIHGVNQVFFPPRRDAALRVVQDDADGYPAHFLSLLDAPAQPLPVVAGFRDLYTLWNEEIGAVWSGREPARAAGERITERSLDLLGTAVQSSSR